MANGNNTQNVELAISLLTTLLSNAAPLAAAIQTAKSTGGDITDEQINSFLAADSAAKAQFQADIDAMPDTPAAGAPHTP